MDKGVDRDEYERLYGLNKKGQSFYIVWIIIIDYSYHFIEVALKLEPMHPLENRDTYLKTIR